MNVKDHLVRSLAKSVEDVFSIMLGASVVVQPVTFEKGAPDAHDGVVSFIGVAGSWVGTGCVACSPALACRVCSQMLMTENTSVNEEVLDALAELTNMIIGSVKNDLEQELGPLGLSIPTVVFGRNFRTKSAGHAEWIVQRFRWDTDELEVRIWLTPSDRPIPVPSRAAGSSDYVSI